LATSPPLTPALPRLDPIRFGMIRAFKNSRPNPRRRQFTNSGESVARSATLQPCFPVNFAAVIQCIWMRCEDAIATTLLPNSKVTLVQGQSGFREQGCKACRVYGGESTFVSPTFDLQLRLLISDRWTTPPPRFLALKTEKQSRHSCACRLAVNSLPYPIPRESSVGWSIAAVVVSPWSAW
jgi:hypothetical protein